MRVQFWQGEARACGTWAPLSRGAARARGLGASSPEPGTRERARDVTTGLVRVWRT
jgi:hypothetical protein